MIIENKNKVGIHKIMIAFLGVEKKGYILG